MVWWLSGGAECSGAAVGAWQIYRSARAVSLMSVDMAGQKEQQQPRWLTRSPTSPWGTTPSPNRHSSETTQTQLQLQSCPSECSLNVLKFEFQMRLAVAAVVNILQKLSTERNKS